MGAGGAGVLSSGTRHSVASSSAMVGRQLSRPRQLEARRGLVNPQLSTPPDQSDARRWQAILGDLAAPGRPGLLLYLIPGRIVVRSPFRFFDVHSRRTWLCL